MTKWEGVWFSTQVQAAKESWRIHCMREYRFQSSKGISGWICRLMCLRLLIIASKELMSRALIWSILRAIAKSERYSRWDLPCMMMIFKSILICKRLWIILPWMNLEVIVRKFYLKMCQRIWILCREFNFAISLYFHSASQTKWNQIKENQIRNWQNKNSKDLKMQMESAPRKLLLGEFYQQMHLTWSKRNQCPSKLRDHRNSNWGK